jgi:hypothetical protein
MKNKIIAGHLKSILYTNNMSQVYIFDNHRVSDTVRASPTSPYIHFVLSFFGKHTKKALQQLPKPALEISQLCKSRPRARNSPRALSTADRSLSASTPPSRCAISFPRSSRARFPSLPPPSRVNKRGRCLLFVFPFTAVRSTVSRSPGCAISPFALEKILLFDLLQARRQGPGILLFDLLQPCSCFVVSFWSISHLLVLMPT